MKKHLTQAHITTPDLKKKSKKLLVKFCSFDSFSVMGALHLASCPCPGDTWAGRTEKSENGRVV
jgi:hypothetical protein